MYHVRKRVAVSYSGGKDSALAMYRTVQLGYEPVCILTTYDSEAGRSWFHGLPTEILEQIRKKFFGKTGRKAVERIGKTDKNRVKYIGKTDR